MTEHDSPAPAPESGASDRSLLERCRSGSEDAAVQLYRRYAQRLRDLARAQCSPDLARRVEADDIVQSVFGSFFRGVRQGYYDLPQGEDLWKLFLVIALNKIRARGAYFRAAKRDIRRTVGGGWYDHTLESVASGDESAQAALQLAVDDALDRVPPGHRDAVRLRIEGFEVAEIARRLGRSKRSTERLLQEARQRLTELLQVED
jgi:RNA polymerase sigma-70 factor (ECF subfamily)